MSDRELAGLLHPDPPRRHRGRGDDATRVEPLTVAPKTEAKREGDAFLFSWPALGIAVAIDQLREAGDGGQGKSWLALALAVAVATGKSLPCGLRPTRTCPVLYLDWESSEAELADRLRALLAGMGVRDYAGEVHYRRMTRGLTDDANFLR